MRSAISFFLILLSFQTKSQDQLADPLTINDIMDFKTLMYKHDFESILKMLSYDKFEFSKKEENYDHGSYYVIADFECKRSLGVVESHTFNLIAHPEEEIKLSYIDKGEFYELNISHSFTSEGDFFKSTFDYLKGLNWVMADIGDSKKAHEIALGKQAVDPNYHLNYDEEFGYLIDGWDGKHTYSFVNRNSLILRDSYKKYLFANISDNNLFSQTYSCYIQNSGITKRFRYNIRSDALLEYRFLVFESIPKFSEENNSPDPLGLFKNTFQIPLIKSGNIFYVNVNIGGITKKYIFDSGASDVTLTQSTYDRLVSNGIIQFKHRLPTGSYKLADGTIVEYKRTLIPSLSLGGKKISNVAASIVPDDQPLLLGKSFLDKFKTWKIDNSKNILIIQGD